MDTNSNRNWSFLIYLTLMLTTFVVFYQVHSFEFVNYDDPAMVYKNPDVQAGITLKTIKWAFYNEDWCMWHPLTWFSHMLDWQLFGNNAGGHHLVSLIFHIANTLLLFIVLKKMTGALWSSAFVAALFALHPLHIQSVAWVSERKDVLSTFFWMLTMWAYVRFVGRPKIANYLLVIVFLALGLMAKAMLVTLPFVLLLLDYWPLERLGTKRSLSRLLIEKIPLFAVVLASCIVTFIAQKRGGAAHTLENCSLPVRFANTFISYVQYIIKMIWPTHLAVFYPHPGQNVSVPIAVISAIFLLIVTVLVFRFARNHKYLVTGWFWYLGTLVPVIGLVQVGDQALADRYSYVTLTGLFIIIAWGMPELLAKWRYKKIALAVSAILIVLVLAVYTYFQLGYWRNSQILFQHALDVTGDNYTMHLSISESLREQGRLDEAIYHCSEAVRIKPEGFMAHIWLGYILRETGRLGEASEEYRKCIQIKPDDPNTLNILGTIVGQLGRFDEAVKYFTQALRIDPNSADTHTNIGFALSCQGKLDEAVAHLTEALRLDPNSALTHYHLGRILAQQGKIDQAIAHFEQAVQIDPNDTDARNSLNLALSEKQKLQNKDTENEKKAGKP
ncbi:MAG: tetratricopeptide repeat protein [Sedimentisphaerales bacterium]